jgi:hypothetical protein
MTTTSARLEALSARLIERNASPDEYRARMLAALRRIERTSRSATR